MSEDRDLNEQVFEDRDEAGYEVHEHYQQENMQQPHHRYSHYEQQQEQPPLASYSPQRAPGHGYFGEGTHHVQDQLRQPLISQVPKSQLKPEELKMPLIQQYNRTPELSVSHVFKLRPEELSLFFRKEHLDLPENQGEKRESLVILEKVGLNAGLLKSVGTDGETGIIGDAKDLKRRRNFFGSNAKKVPKGKSYLSLILPQLEDLNLRILLVAGFFTLVIGLFSEQKYEWVEGASIFFAIAFIVLFTATNDYAKEKQLQKLHEEIRNEEVNVVRGQYGLSSAVKVIDVVVGDVILVETGMRIPADCVLISGTDVVVDEGIYHEGRETLMKKAVSTGDNHRDNPDPFLLARSLVMNGSGMAVVCCVGKHCYINEQLEKETLADYEEEMTQLQQRLERIAGQIGAYGYIAAAIIFIAQMVFYIFKIMISSNTQLLTNATLLKVLDFFTTAMAIIIVAVPEGLPLAVSISMAFSIDTMKQDKLLVKKMDACETLGMVNEICTGKTGTLTNNQMQVRQFYTAQGNVEVRESHHLQTCNLPKNVVETIRDCIVYNCQSRVELSEDAKYIPVGNGTEVGMLKFLQESEFDIQDLFKKREVFGSVETHIPFGPINKRELIAIKPKRDSEFVRVVIKGAPEYVLPMCKNQFSRQGEQIDFPQDQIENFLEQRVYQDMAKQGLRTFAYAYKDIDCYAWEDMKKSYNNFLTERDRQYLENEFCFVAVFGLLDDLRKGVKESIEKLKAGGVNVIMLSGDNLHTAIHCAQQASIIKKGDEAGDKVCMTGKEFRELVGGVKKTIVNEGMPPKYEINNKQQFRTLIKKVKVLARCEPEDKFAMIVGIQENSGCVAMTADGINDARALKQANVGFAMGIAGCEVAKESSDIVILDDNFTSVFRAVQYGRNLYDNIRKFIQYQLTVSIVCILSVFLSGATLGESPFNVIQLLWINMIMDTLAAIQLATEPPHRDVLGDRVRKTDSIITKVMWRNILGVALYQFLVMVTLIFFAPFMFNKKYDYYNYPFYVVDPTDPNAMIASEKTQHYTLVFLTFILMQLFNSFNSRRLGVKDFNVFEDYFSSFWHLIILAIEFGATWLMVLFGGKIFRTTKITWQMLIATFSFGIGCLLVSLALKAIPHQHLQHLPDLINENAGEGDHVVKFVSQHVQGNKPKRSETERLLDSN